jgi:Zn-dependent protease with chaperone function
MKSTAREAGVLCLKRFSEGGRMRWLRLARGLLPARGRFVWLLASLLLVLVAVPLIEDRAIRSWLSHICLSFVFLAAVLANRRRKGVLIAAGVIAALAAVLDWATSFWSSVPLSLASYGVAVLFLEPGEIVTRLTRIPHIRAHRHDVPKDRLDPPA